MAGTDGSIAFDSGIKTDGLKKDLSEIEEAISDSANSAEKKAEKASDNMRSQAAKLAAEYKKAGMNASDAMKKALEEVKNGAPAFQKAEKEVENFASQAETELQNVGESANQSFQKIPESAKKNFEDAGLSADNFAQKVQSALAAAGLAYGAKEIVDVGVSYEKAMNQVAASTGAAGAELEDLQGSIQSIYTSGIGENLESIADAVTLVKQQFGDIDSDTLEQITRDATIMTDTFGTDLNETLRGVNALMTNMGLTAEEAFDYIAKGTQNGLDKSGELSDNLAEYSQIWSQAGFSAEEMFSVLQNGLDSGAYNLDKVNDFVKEFTISLSDGRIAENIGSFSLGTQNLFEQWQNGKATQKDVFDSIIRDLSGMTDQQEALTIASTVWSALGEDNAMKVITSLNNVNDTYSDVKGTMESIKEVNYNDLGNQMEALKRKIEMELVVPVAKKYMPQIEKAIDYVSEHLDEIVEHAKPVAVAIASTFAVKKLTDFSVSAVKTVKTVKTAFQALNTSNPLGWIALGLGAATSAVTALVANAKKKSQEWKDHLEEVRESAAKIPDEVQKSIDKTEECAEAWDGMQQQMQKDGIVEDSDFEAVNKLKDSLMALINADGTIKEGQEEKVQSLIDQLNQYSNTGITVSDGLIMKNDEVVGSYNKISGAIDEVIQKQHAQNYLDMIGDAAKESQQQRPELLKAATEQNQELQAKKEERQQIIDEMANMRAKDTAYVYGGELLFTDMGDYKTYEDLKQKLNGVNDSIQTLSTTYHETTTQLQEGKNAIDAYKEASEAYANGDFDTVSQSFSDMANNFLTASIATAAQLKIQEEDARAHYETLKQMAEENPGSVLAADLEEAKRFAENSAIELEIKTGEHGDNAGKTFLDSLAASGMNQDEKLDALNRYIEERLDNGDSLGEIAKKVGIDYSAGFEGGIYDGIPGIEEAVKALGKAAEAHLRISIDSHSPSKLSKEIGGDWDEGFVLGIEKGIPDVSAVSSDMANAVVSSTLGIMNAQGASAVAPYNPIFTRAYSAPQQSTSTAALANSTPQNGGDIIIPISIGDETIETVVVDAITRANASSGGRSV